MSLLYNFSEYLKSGKTVGSYVFGNTVNDVGTIVGASVTSTLSGLSSLAQADASTEYWNNKTEAIRNARSDAYHSGGKFLKGVYNAGEFLAPAALGAGAAGLAGKGAQALGAGSRARFLASTLAGAGAEATVSAGQNMAEGGEFGDTFVQDLLLNTAGAYGAGMYMRRANSYRFNPRYLEGDFSQPPLRRQINVERGGPRKLHAERPINEVQRFSVLEPTEQVLSDSLTGGD